MAMAGMAGTAVGVAIAVLKEKADRRSIEREVQEEIEAEEAALAILEEGGDGSSDGTGDESEADHTKPQDD